MGIFSVFSRRKKEKAAQEQQAQIDAPEKIHYADVPAWLDSTLSQKVEKTRKRTEELCEMIIAKKEALEEKIEELGEQSFDPTDRTYAKVNMAKDTFVKRSLAELEGIARPRETGSFDALSEFSEKTFSSLDSIKNATPKQAILISNYFKKQSSEMVAAIKGLESAASELSRFLKFDGALLKHAKEAKASLARMAELDTERRVDDINLSKASVLESAIGNKIKNKQAELDALMKSDEWKLYAESLAKLDELEQAAKNTEQNANNMLAVLRKPMKRLSHDKGTAGLPENPFRSIILPGGSISSIVRAILEAESAGDIALKSGEREKINALDDAGFEGLKKSYNEAKDERARLEGSADVSLPERKKSLEQEIASLDEDSLRARKEVEFLEEKIRRNNEEKQKQLAETRRAVQAAVGKEVNITLQKNAG